MSDIRALEGRITQALDRIGRGIAAHVGAGASDAELIVALENERAANAELVERFRSLKARQDTNIANLTERIDKQRVQLAAYDAQMQSLRASNEQMREINTLLREAVTKGLAPELVEVAIEAELRAITEQRLAEATEIDAIISELKPLVQEKPHAAG